MIVKTASLKLLPTPEQHKALLETGTMFAAACSQVAFTAASERCFNRFKLHTLTFNNTRASYEPLGSQFACQAVARVAAAYKTLKSKGELSPRKPVPTVIFSRPTVSYDARTCAIRETFASLRVLGGRIKVPYTCGKHQRNLLASGTQASPTLTLVKGIWYLQVPVKIQPPEKTLSRDILGVDIGENVLAATSTGKIFGGGQLRHQRDMYLAERGRLQNNGSKAAIRKLHSISGKERHHVKLVNHEVSKAIVQEALSSGKGVIALEDLTHIRDNIRGGRRMKSRLHRWAFRQLQTDIEYKALAEGLYVVYINPAYTSKTCSVCGRIGHRVKHSFTCECGTRRHADVNASVNIARLGSQVTL
jgi:IS605 OrfB family transposase